MMYNSKHAACVARGESLCAEYGGCSVALKRQQICLVGLKVALNFWWNLSNRTDVLRTGCRQLQGVARSEAGRSDRLWCPT